MIQNPIRKVLSTFSAHAVRGLLMGGQACVLYGAGEFSRDSDFAVLAEQDNLERIRQALADLKAEVIAVPPFTLAYLQKGHAVHFRCQHAEAAGLRIDIMSKMRGVAAFDKLWKRRTTLELQGGPVVEIMGLADLVAAKKTQRDKDWPMIRRLLEADYVTSADSPAERIRFWLLEMRTPDILMELCRRYPAMALDAADLRPAVRAAMAADASLVEQSLRAEAETERRLDAEYWQPLRRELELLRHASFKT